MNRWSATCYRQYLIPVIIILWIIIYSFVFMMFWVCSNCQWLFTKWMASIFKASRSLQSSCCPNKPFEHYDHELHECFLIFSHMGTWLKSTCSTMCKHSTLCLITVVVYVPYHYYLLPKTCITIVILVAAPFMIFFSIMLFRKLKLLQEMHRWAAAMPTPPHPLIKCCYNKIFQYLLGFDKLVYVTIPIQYDHVCIIDCIIDWGTIFFWVF